eukprot:TRINITY_DN2891_c0_g2_i2.p1 TRINITY_DN2891_c0_g2~~TRINITY_DN2891_c0_g2_i2.p1  ORF type:complete len:486 (+),score=88.87 TRINITY_DN2891_c0_g2_i2:93-1550(+)
MGSCVGGGVGADAGFALVNHDIFLPFSEIGDGSKWPREMPAALDRLSRMFGRAEPGTERHLYSFSDPYRPIIRRLDPLRWSWTVPAVPRSRPCTIVSPVCSHSQTRFRAMLRVPVHGACAFCLLPTGVSAPLPRYFSAVSQMTPESTYLGCYIAHGTQTGPDVVSMRLTPGPGADRKAPTGNVMLPAPAAPAAEVSTTGAAERVPTSTLPMSFTEVDWAETPPDTPTGQTAGTEPKRISAELSEHRPSSHAADTPCTPLEISPAPPPGGARRSISQQRRLSVTVDVSPQPCSPRSSGAGTSPRNGQRSPSRFRERAEPPSLCLPHQCSFSARDELVADLLQQGRTSPRSALLQRRGVGGGPAAGKLQISTRNFLADQHQPSGLRTARSARSMRSMRQAWTTGKGDPAPRSPTQAALRRQAAECVLDGMLRLPASDTQAPGAPAAFQPFHADSDPWPVPLHPHMRKQSRLTALSYHITIEFDGPLR